MCHTWMVWDLVLWLQGFLVFINCVIGGSVWNRPYGLLQIRCRRFVKATRSNKAPWRRKRKATTTTTTAAATTTLIWTMMEHFFLWFFSSPVQLGQGFCKPSLPRVDKGCWAETVSQKRSRNGNSLFIVMRDNWYVDDNTIYIFIYLFLYMYICSIHIN